jgi:putative endonuclease
VGSSHAQRKAVGDFGERVACRYLTAQGLTVLDRNWRCPDGEIDIVAMDADVIVVCEVKTRSDARYGTPVEAITATKADRLYRLGRLWIGEHDVGLSALRIDVVAVLCGRPGPATVEHLVGVL